MSDHAERKGKDTKNIKYKKKTVEVREWTGQKAARRKGVVTEESETASERRTPLCHSSGLFPLFLFIAKNLSPSPPFLPAPFFSLLSEAKKERAKSEEQTHDTLQAHFNRLSKFLFFLPLSFASVFPVQETLFHGIHFPSLPSESRPLSCLHEVGAPSGGSTPSGCCSQRECGRPRAAFRRRSDAADRGGSPPCPGSLP